jgi:membrane-associated phospholipid phosphatase
MRMKLLVIAGTALIVLTGVVMVGLVEELDAVTADVVHLDGFADQARLVSLVGSDTGALVIAIMAGVVFAVVDRRVILLLVLVAVFIGALALTNLLKSVADRPGPKTVLAGGVSGRAYPSAQTAQATAVVGTIAVLASRRRDGKFRESALLFAGVVVVGVGLSRMLLGHHWLTDVVGGVLVGLVWVGLVEAGLEGVER